MRHAGGLAGPHLYGFRPMEGVSNSPQLESQHCLNRELKDIQVDTWVNNGSQDLADQILFPFGHDCRWNPVQRAIDTDEGNVNLCIEAASDSAYALCYEGNDTVRARLSLALLQDRAYECSL